MHKLTITVERSKTGRSHCIFCKKLISEKDKRVKIVVQGSSGSMDMSPTYCHGKCMKLKLKDA